METLGSRVKRLREERGWSQNELGRRALVRQSLISELERGRKQDTTGSVLQRLANTLEVSVDYLLGRTRRRKDDDPVMRSAGERDSLVGTAALLEAHTP